MKRNTCTAFITAISLKMIFWCILLILTYYPLADVLAQMRYERQQERRSFGSKAGHEAEWEDEDLAAEEYQWLGLAIEKGVINNPDFRTITQFSLSSGRYIDKNNWISLIAGYGWTHAESNSSLKSVIEDGFDLYSLGLEFKTFAFAGLMRSQYLLLGFDFSAISFGYKMYDFYYYWVDENGQLRSEKNSEDRVMAVGLHTGMGFNIYRSGRNRVDIEAVPGILISARATNIGFINDIFDNFLYFKLKLSFGYATKKFD